MKLTYGKELADKICAESKTESERLQGGGVTPRLVSLSDVEDKGVQSYIRSIKRSCGKSSIDFVDENFASSDTNEDISSRIETLAESNDVHGIILQWPLPDHLDPALLFGAIPVDKDVDGLSPVSAMQLVMGKPGFIPCTAQAVLEILVRGGVNLNGVHVVVVGRSPTVGKALALALLIKRPELNATVTICHTGTNRLGDFTRSAGVLIVAAGSPRLVDADMVSDGAIVIDVGINVVDHPATGKKVIVGDVDYNSVSRVASQVTPVPGGVGPVTTAILGDHVVTAAKRSCNDGS